jgi:hypothetical protein
MTGLSPAADIGPAFTFRAVPTAARSRAKQTPAELKEHAAKISAKHNDELRGPGAEPVAKLEAALDAAHRGFPVFPLKQYIAPGTEATEQQRKDAIDRAKEPCIRKWPQLATTDESQIRRWWAQWPQANIGGAMAGFLAVDVDPRHGGDTAFEALNMVEGFTETALSQTWSDGAHHVYRLPPDTSLGNSVGKVAPGIDIRSGGGFIVLPGSTIEGRAYRWANDLKPAIAPQWLMGHCKAARLKGANAGKRLMEEDETAIRLAATWLMRCAPDAVEGHRDQTAYENALILFDKGVTNRTAHEMMLEWNQERCFPPLDESVIAQKVNSAECNRSRPIGCDHPLAPAFEPYEIAERAAPPLAPQIETLNNQSTDPEATVSAIATAPRQAKIASSYDRALAYIIGVAPIPEELSEREPMARVVAAYIASCELPEAFDLMQLWNLSSCDPVLEAATLESVLHAAMAALACAATAKPRATVHKLRPDISLSVPAQIAPDTTESPPADTDPTQTAESHALVDDGDAAQSPKASPSQESVAATGAGEGDRRQSVTPLLLAAPQSKLADDVAVVEAERALIADAPAPAVAVPLQEAERAALTVRETTDAKAAAEAARKKAAAPEFMPLLPFDVAAIPPRDWIIKDLACRRVVSAVVGPAGVAKSTWTLQMALAAATGRSDICGFKIAKRKRVAIWNQEDDPEEIQRRIAAIMQAFNIGFDDLLDDDGTPMIYFGSGVELPLLLAQRRSDGTLVPGGKLNALIDILKTQRADILILDPLVEMHQAPENDNVLMGAVLGYIRSIAVAANCAVLVVAHVRKPDKARSDGYAGDMDSWRGASAQGGVIRIGVTIFNAQDKDKKSWAFEGSHLDYVRLDIGKNNFGPKSREPMWFRYEGVPIGGCGGEVVGIVRPATPKRIGVTVGGTDILLILAKTIAANSTCNGQKFSKIAEHMPPADIEAFPALNHRADAIDKAFGGAEEYATDFGILKRRNRGGSTGWVFSLAVCSPIPASGGGE